MVEIGYEIAPPYHKLGLATEAAQAMIAYAFSHPQVKAVDAHTLPEMNASARVLQKVGMHLVGTDHAPEIGLVWHWRLPRL